MIALVGCDNGIIKGDLSIFILIFNIKLGEIQIQVFFFNLHIGIDSANLYSNFFLPTALSPSKSISDLLVTSEEVCSIIIILVYVEIRICLSN